MKHITRNYLACLAAGALMVAASAQAAASKTYQVTGPVLEVTPTTITVQKGNDKWEIARNANTKTTGDVKVGTRVTIYYTMTASEIEVKEAKGKKK
jgi:ABC-type glycerol-3-phosphate transport system substrate-binding protein